MNEIIQIEAPIQLPAPVQKTLQEQREDLRLRLQINRRLLAHKLSSGSNGNEGYAPRSATMRFLSRPSTRHIVQSIAGTALGLQAFKSLRYGFSVVQFIRSAYSAVKATRNVVKAKEDI